MRTIAWLAAVGAIGSAVVLACGGSVSNGAAPDAGPEAQVDSGAQVVDSGSHADAGSEAQSPCANLVPPNTTAGCQCPAGRTCNANGCRYTDYCDTATNTCGPAPVGCGTAGNGYDGGTAPTGTVGADGGSLSRLYFAVVGDTRPPSEDDTSGYPTDIITKIFTSMEALSPKPAFALSTGDYQYANPSGTEGAAQLDLYMGARAKYSGPTFPAMGNHECTGYTTSNCGAGNPDGITANYTAFLQKMLAPINQTNPYYEIDVDAPDGSWTSKMLVVAANAWTTEQGTWLDTAMTRATTYTFLVRHESATANTAPGVTPAEYIMYKHPYTLSIVGHTHTYQRTTQREVIMGNGGAPLSGGVDYGFGMFSQQTDGSIAIDMIDYASGLADSSFHYAVKPDGSPAP
jgi:hypothetical protein